VARTDDVPTLVLFNQPAAHADPQDRAAEVGVLDSVAAATAVLSQAGASVESLGLAGEIEPLVAACRAGRCVVLNLCEAFAGATIHEAHVAGLLELLGTAYTGSPPATIALCRDKIRTKHLLRSAGVRTAPFLCIGRESRDVPPQDWPARFGWDNPTFPFIVKAANEDASQGLDHGSVVQTPADLAAAVGRLAQRYGFPVLAESYLPGREFNVAVIEDAEPRCLPLAEIVFTPRAEPSWPIVTYESKWNAGSRDDLTSRPQCPAVVDRDLADDLCRLGLAAFQISGCRDYARIDFRLNAAGEPTLLEVNPNPDLSPSAGLARQLAAAGIGYAEFIVRLVQRARARGTADATARQTESKPAASRAMDSAVTLRDLQPSDREAIGGLVRRCGNFRPEEIDVALELVDEKLSRGPACDYRFVIAAVDGQVVGYSCFGPTPLTDGTWDLYWIAVDPNVQGQGVAAGLQSATEQQVRAAGGRLVLAETSSLPEYARARGFYIRQGYHLVERLADFYRPGDDRLTFGKHL
jgi:D-alanine-D-alanine ligase